MAECLQNGKKSPELPDIKEVDPETNRQLLEDFTGERTGFLQVGREKWFFPSKYAEDAEHFLNFETRPDDTWVITFPRSGTTWTQELVWMVANNMDFKTAARIPLTERFPFLEFSIFVHEETKAEFFAENSHSPENQAMLETIMAPGWKVLAEAPSPRFIKTHFPFSLLPRDLLTSGGKVIYVARNPKDVAVSFYHLNRLWRTQGYKGDFPKYWDYFEKNLNPWTPYWSHVNEGWERRDDPNVLFMFYEDMNKDLPDTIHKVSQFLNKPITEEQIDQLCEYLKIDNFRMNPSVNCAMLKDLGILNSGEQDFVRKGKTGGWAEEFTPELSERADRWIQENLEKTDLRFP